MSITISITESELYEALKNFIAGILGTSWPIVQGQVNRAAMPATHFVQMTSLLKPALSTPKTTYTDPGTNPGSVGYSASTQWRCQLDFYGDGAADAAKTVADLVRTPYACDQFSSSGVDVAPLYAEDPKNTTLINAEQQYEERWTVDFLAQFNPVVATPVDFADKLNVGLVEVDTTYPPQEQ